MTFTRRLRESCWPLGPTSVIVPAAAIVVVVVVAAATWPMLGWPYPLWVQTSAQFHQQVAWAGLIAGTSACWYASVLHQRDQIWAPWAPRLSMPAATRHLTVLSGWLVGAYLVALLPLLMSTVVTGGVGTPDPLAMLSGVLAMVATVAIGYAAGTVVPSAVMVPIVAAGFYALLTVGSTGEGYAAAAPVLYREPDLGQRESLPLLVFRIALFVMIIGGAVGLTRKSLNRTATGTAHPWRRIADVGTYLAAPAALIAISLIHPAVMFTTDDQPPTSCTERRDIRYCVHTDNQPRLADLVRAVDPLVARFGTKPANLDQVWDQALTFRPIDADVAHDLVLAWLNPDGTIQTPIAATIAGVHACASAEPDAQRTEEDIERLAQVAADISNYLSTGTPGGTLSRMSVTDVQQWIAQHQERLRTCTLTTG
jgi:hypothetical protein